MDGQWRCDAWRFVEGCKSNLNAFGLSAGLPRWTCYLCDFDLCEPCFMDHRRNSAQRTPRPAEMPVGQPPLTVGIFSQYALLSE